MKKILNLIKKNIFGVIIVGIIFGSVGVYAGTKFYASDVSIDSPTGSNLGSSATLQNALDDLYSKINSYTKLYSNGTVIYYNPTTGEKCTSSSAISTTGTKNGCMKWYTFNDEEGNSSVNLILDHNTTAKVQWNSSGSNSEMNEVAKQLTLDTKDWVVGARLITANEVAKISGNTNWDSSKIGQDWFCLDTNNQDSTSFPYCSNTGKMGWLYDHTRCKEEYYDWKCLNNDLSTYGYWTSSTRKDDSISAWIVDRPSSVTYYNVDTTYDLGVRPVITISKSIIK